MKVISGLAAAAALFACAGVAQANTYVIKDAGRVDGSLVPHATYSVAETYQGSGAFQDGFNFKLDSAYNGGFSAAFIQDTDVGSSIADAMISLYSGVYAGVANAANLIATTGSFDPDGHVPTLKAKDLAAGSYYILANITPDAGYGANYSVNVTLGNVSSAPEPGTWALMIAGVGLAGAAFRRGRRYRTAGLLA